MIAGKWGMTEGEEGMTKEHVVFNAVGTDSSLEMLIPWYIRPFMAGKIYGKTDFAQRIFNN